MRDRGVSFTRAFASYPLCCPSRTTFLTGQHSHNHGVLGNGTPIGGFDALDEQNTLGVWLQTAGYHTIQVGKFLNGYGVRDPRYIPPGWDEWVAAPDSTTNRYFDYDLNVDGDIVRYGGAPGDYKSDVYTETALRADPAARPARSRGRAVLPVRRIHGSPPAGDRCHAGPGPLPREPAAASPLLQRARRLRQASLHP